MKVEKIEQTALVKVVTESGLTIEEGETIKQSYQPFIEQLADVQEQAKKIDFENPAEIDETIARELRLKTVKIRTGSEKLKDDRKRGYMLRGNLEQAAYNLIAASCKVTENALNEVEKAREIAEARRKESLKLERSEKLAAYVENVAIFPLGEMSEADFDALYFSAKAQHEAKIEAEEKAEADRLAKIEAERLEQERIKAENEKLQAELKAKEEEAAKLKAEADEKQRIADEKAKAEKLAREKAEKEAADLKAAEEKRLKEIAEAEAAEAKAKLAEAKRLAKAPEKERLQRWVNCCKFTEEIDQSKLTDGAEIARAIAEKFAAFKKWSNQQIETL